MIDVPIQVKDALREGRLRKNYRFQVLNDDGTVDFTIANDNLVSESVNIDERMCSGDKIKYGLCEGSSLEFQYFGKENITGRQLKVFVDVEHEDESAYTYTDVEEFPRFDPVTITTPGHYKVYSAVEGVSFEVYLTRGSKTTGFDSVATEDGAEIVLGELKSGDSLELTWGSMFWTAPMLQVGTAAPYAIPMGYFTVKNCSRQASTGIIKAVCYNKLQSDYLDAKANDEILALFGDNNKYVIDVLRALLNGFEIDKREYSEIPDVSTYPDTESRASYFSPFRYTTMKGDQGPFSAFLATQLPHPATTSSNMYLEGSAFLYEYIFQGSTLHKPVKIDVDMLINQLDENIAIFLQNCLNKVNANVSGNVLWDRLRSMRGLETLTPSANLLGYFCNVVIEFEDNSHKIYGNTVKNADGTFLDLNNTTFLNVSKVYLLTPEYVIFGNHLSSGSEGGFIDENIDATLVGWGENKVYCYGSDRIYSYEDASGNVHTRVPYTTPKMPNGSNIQRNTLKNCFVVKAIMEGTSDADFITINPTSISEVTLRELQSAVYETEAQFGQLSRETDLFSGVELNRSRLLPADTLYPDNALYPGGAAESAFRSLYSKLWADEGNVRKWRYLIITYKGLDENQQEKDFTLQRTVNADGTDDYNCSDNWLFRNLIWTAADIGTYADAMVLKMQDITWFPFEMWCAGLPYLETGDEIEIPLGTETYTSYILQRQLKGIQNLQDTYINGTLDIF